MRVLSALLPAFALLPLLTRAAFHSNDTACTRHYTVESGDTCDKIGQKTLTSTYQILAFNLLSAGADCYTLEIGTRLCLGRYGNDCQFVHECTSQDTCESIASAYGISTELLQNNNPSLDCNVVYDGLMLCVSAGSIRPPADDSLNATDVMAAREQARQMWLVQEKAKLPQPESGSEQKNKATANHSHTPHASHSNKHHQHAGESSHKPASQPKPVAEKTSSPKQQRAASDDASSQEQQNTSSQEDLRAQFVDDLLTSTPSGSNHTPNLQQQESPLVGTDSATAQHKRHRSLSSRSHHQRSHTR